MGRQEKKRWSNRRHGTNAAAVVATGIILFLSACHHRESQRSTPAPRDADVLLITLDTTRADHLSCYATGHAQTPNLDALAARGVRFTNATVQAPLTIPSHACIMTGTYPPVHGLRDMDGFVLDKSHPTIASLTQAAGFVTAAFVGSRVLAKHFGLSHGIDTYDDEMDAEKEETRLPGDFAERRARVGGAVVVFEVWQSCDRLEVEGH